MEGLRVLGIDSARELVEEITQSLSDITTDSRHELHEEVIQTVYKLLTRRDWHAEKEYEYQFTTVRRRDGLKQTKGGRIDLLGRKQDIILAVEMDTGLRLKYKSIEKILQKSDVGIGIVRGGSFQDTATRIELVLRENERFDARSYG